MRIRSAGDSVVVEATARNIATATRSTGERTDILAQNPTAGKNARGDLAADDIVTLCTPPVNRGST